LMGVVTCRFLDGTRVLSAVEGLATISETSDGRIEIAFRHAKNERLLKSARIGARGRLSLLNGAEKDLSKRMPVRLMKIAQKNGSWLLELSSPDVERICGRSGSRRSQAMETERFVRLEFRAETLLQVAFRKATALNFAAAGRE